LNNDDQNHRIEQELKLFASSFSEWHQSNNEIEKVFQNIILLVILVLWIVFLVAS